MTAEFADQASDHDPAYALSGGASPTCDIVAGASTWSWGPTARTLRAQPSRHDPRGPPTTSSMARTSKDALFGGDGNDLLVGGDAADTLVGDAGSDVRHGGNAADVFDASDGFANDEVDGSAGSDDCGDVDVGDVVVDR